MRLTATERDAIQACAARHFGAGCKVRLFGSRTDDALRGGDIDLHIETSSDDVATLATELTFRLALADLIGEQQVDVIVRGPGNVPKTIDLIAHRTGLVIS